MRFWRLLVLLLLFTACRSSAPVTPGDTFALHRLETSLSIDDLVTAEPDTLPCTGEALITLADIQHYNWQTHTMTLSPEAAVRLSALDLVGTPFVVCVNETPIYAGVLWASYFSRSYDGIIIDLINVSHDARLHIATGYPESPESFRGQDRRSDVRIWRALHAAGKTP